MGQEGNVATPEGIDLRGRFNKSARIILNENDSNPDEASRERVRNSTLAEINNLRRWVQEVYGVEIHGATGE